MKEVNWLSDSLFFLPPSDHDKAFSYAGSSIASALSVNVIGETSMPALLSNNWPLDVNRFTDLPDEWGGLYPGLDHAGNPIDTPTHPIDYLSTDLGLLDSNSSVQQSTQFGLPMEMVSSLSSDSSKT